MRSEAQKQGSDKAKVDIPGKGSLNALLTFTTTILPPRNKKNVSLEWAS